MCGRTACNQCREVYQKAASYYSERRSSHEQPRWRDVPNGGKEFKPSTNMAPTDVTPVLLSSHLVSEDSTERVLLPMMWGLIPPWHKGTFKNHGLSTNNCRVESVGSSKLYGPLLKEGRRCVVICDGFYEWQTTVKAKTKQPYFIYSNQKSQDGVVSERRWSDAEWSGSDGWNGPRLLCMAGLYHVWQSPQGDEIYNYTIITRESKKDFSWLHHRVPAILPDDKLVQEWLDSKSVSMYEALKCLESVEDNLLSWHEVSTAVNKSSNKSEDCTKRIQIKKNTSLTSWLSKAQPQKRESSSSSASVDMKKSKIDDDK